MKVNFYIFLVCCWLLTSAFTLPQYPIRYLGIEQGLSNNAVTCVTQDAYGFIWAGTYNGLNRYDGSDFKVFRNVSGTGNLLINNHIKSISAASGRLFVGTEKGLVSLNYADMQYHQLYLSDRQTRRRQAILSDISKTLTSREGFTFAATANKGLLVFNRDDTVGVQVPLNGRFDYNVHAMTFDAGGQLWLFSDGNGLARYNPQKKTATLVIKPVESAGTLAHDKAGRIWIGTDNGLFIYDPVRHKTEPFKSRTGQLTSRHIANLTLAPNGRMWIATGGGGINIWDPSSQACTFIGSGSGKLKSAVVSDVFLDDQDRAWVATLRGGLHLLDNKNAPFHSIRHEEGNPNSLINNFVLSFCEEGDDRLWIGTDGGGLSRWNRRSNTFTNYRSGPGGISSDFVVSMIRDKAGSIWIATFNGGIDRYDRQLNKFIHYVCPGLPGKGEEKRFWKLFIDSKQHLWAGSTWGGALYLYDQGKDRFQIFDANLTDVHALFEDHRGNLWGGDYNHLIKIDIARKRHQRYLIGHAIRDINEDKGHQLWVATDGGGLVQVNVQGNIVRRLTEKDGLPDGSVLKILTGEDNRLWCSTFNGLFSYDQKNRKVTSYFLSDGLQSNQFNYNAGLKLSDGQMAFGGINGFNVFFPGSIRSYSDRPKIQLTDLKIADSPLRFGSDLSKAQSIHELRDITVPFDQATLAVTYTALEYSFPDKISYSYMLEGWDHGWSNVGKVKTAHYSRLNEGKYILKIRASDTNGAWASPAYQIKITVLPPWFRTWWAYLLYIAGLGTLAYWLWQEQIKQARLKFEVELANLKIRQEAALNEKKLSFFTNVSHEFRTPLTLIINPLRDMLKSKDSNEDIRTVYRNAKRLLGLVDQLLLFRKTEAEDLPLHAVRTNVTDVAREVFLCFAHQARLKKITFDFEAQEDLKGWIDIDKIQIALFNLIANAIKFTPEGGAIKLTLRADETWLFFEISDTGVGITDDVGERLFEKFYQAKDANSLKTGFGIGLYLVKTFIEQHDGKINYRSIAGKGTTFSLQLPQKHDAENRNTETDLLSVRLLEAVNDEFNDEQDNAAPQLNDLDLLVANKPKIIVIDDNAEMRHYISKILSPDYAVLEAADGDTGLSLIIKVIPDVVISDIVMPGLTGLELCQRIKSEDFLSHIPVILLTGDHLQDLRLKGLEEGAADFIKKPFDKDLLLARVRGILKNRSALQNYFYNEITLRGTPLSMNDEHKTFLYKCMEIIENHLMEPEFDVLTIADKLGVSYSTLYKKVKSITGESINGFIRFVRLRRAAELLIKTNCNVNEAAYRVGFSDPKYFRGQFHKQFGMNPSDFIKKHRTSFQKSILLPR